MVRVRFLWHRFCVGVPHSGLALCDDTKIWFRLNTDVTGNMIPSKTGTGGMYNLYNLDDHIIKLLEEEHKRYQQEIGYHTDHDPDVFKPRNFFETSQTFKFMTIDLSEEKLHGISPIESSDVERLFPPQGN